MRTVRRGVLGSMLAMVLACGFAAAQSSTSANPGTVGPVAPSAETDEAVTLFEDSALLHLPLAAQVWERVEALDSAAHDATPAMSAPGRAGEENENEGTGVDRAGGSAAEFSYSGLAATLNATTVDGLSQQQGFLAMPRGSGSSSAMGGASYAESAVRSVRVMPRSFSAQFGGAGGVVAVRSRGGEMGVRGVHGSAFFVSRESVLAATNPYSVETHYQDGVVTSAAVKPSGMLNEFGVSVGGALGSLQTQVSRARAGAPSSGARTLPTLAGFAAVEGFLRDDHILSTPAEADFFALSQDQLALLGTRGVSTAASNTALDYLDSLTGATARHAYRVKVDARLDWRATANDEAMVAYNGSRLDAPSGAALGQASDAVVARGTGSLGDSVVNVDAVMATWLHRFSPRWSDEVRGQVSHELAYETPHAPLAQEPAIGPGGLAPQVSIAPDGFAYGTPSELGRSAYPDELRVELADTVEVRVGREAISAGGDWNRVHERIASLTAEEGAFLYDSGNVKGYDGGLVDWITDYTFNVKAYPNGGCPSINAAVHDFCFKTYTQGFGANVSASQPGGQTQTEFVTDEFAGFAEDAIRVRDDLLVMVGARYEYELLPLPQTPNLVLDADVAALGSKVGGATGVFPEDRNNVGPRVSVAWAPRFRGKRTGVTVHAGYGVFYGGVPGATVRAALTDTALPSSTTRIRITPTTVTQCPQVTTVSQGFGYPCAFDGAPPAAVSQTTSALVLAQRFRLPMVQRARLEVEREFGGRLLVRAGYAMAVARQLPSSVDLNIAPSSQPASFTLQGGDGYAGLRTGETFVVPVYSQRLIAQYGPVTAVVSDANETYHAGTLEARWRQRGLEVRGSYTYSRAIDFGAQSSATPSVDAQFDPYTVGYDKGLSSLNFPQRFVGDLSWAPAVKRGPAVVRRALNGWRAGAVATAGSGAPYSYAVFGGTRLSGGHETLNGSGGATWLPTVGRNTLRLPERSNVNLRMGREFQAGTVRVNAFAEAFNLLNSRSLSSVETRAFLLETPTTSIGTCPAVTVTTLVFQDAAALGCEGLTTQRAFGVPSSSTAGESKERQVELGVRVRF